MAAFDVLENKRSNVHFSVGMVFHHSRCAAVAEPEAIRMFADAWLDCEALILLATAS